MSSINNSNFYFEVIENEYSIFKNKYPNSEYIPLAYISTILTHHFGENSCILSYSPNHLVCKTTIQILLSTVPITNWKYNRPPDAVRCNDIALYIYNSQTPIDTMMYLNYNNKTHTFEVLDGIHRFTALKKLYEENNKPLELLCPGDFGSNGDAKWLYASPILLNIRFNATEGDLIETFKNLNKSQAVPDLYIKDNAKDKKEIIERIANEWQIKYKKHFSSSSNPITGNTNRNKFVELLDKLYDKYEIEEKGITKLNAILDNVNSYLMRNIPKKVSGDIRFRCSESGCYLFLLKNDVLLDKLF
uniref:Uncharacterized protein n=1 Tax=viral metagenome TaxID=1070528 RepID=A0A6C0ITK3_9ZZZZ